MVYIEELQGVLKYLLSCYKNQFKNFWPKNPENVSVCHFFSLGWRDRAWAQPFGKSLTKHSGFRLAYLGQNHLLNPKTNIRVSDFWKIQSPKTHDYFFRRKGSP